MNLPWIEIFKLAGPTVAVIFFFLYKDWRREKDLNRRIDRLETYQRDTLENLVEKTTTVLIQSTECIKWVGKLMDRLLAVCPRMDGPDCE